MRRFVKFPDIRFFALAGIVLFLLALLASSLWRIFEKKQEIGERIYDVEKKVVKLRHENEKMEEILQQAATPSFIEKEARRRLNLKKPGEKMVIIVPPTGMKHPTQNMEQTEEDILSKSSRISVWEWFKKVFRP